MTHPCSVAHVLSGLPASKQQQTCEVPKAPVLGSHACLHPDGRPICICTFRTFRAVPVPWATTSSGTCATLTSQQVRASTRHDVDFSSKEDRTGMSSGIREPERSTSIDSETHCGSRDLPLSGNGTCTALPALRVSRDELATACTRWRPQAMSTACRAECTLLRLVSATSLTVSACSPLRKAPPC